MHRWSSALVNSVPTSWQEWDDFIRNPRASELKSGTLVAVADESGLHRYGEILRRGGPAWQRWYEVLEDCAGSIRTHT
jgi:hypothetical protein